MCFNLTAFPTSVIMKKQPLTICLRTRFGTLIACSIIEIKNNISYAGKRQYFHTHGKHLPDH